MAKRRRVDIRISRLVLQVGLMCARLRRFNDAERIIRAIKAFRDEVPLPGTVLAMSFYCEGRVQDALRELDIVLAAYPNHQLGKAFLGLIHKKTGRTDGERLLREVIEDGRDEWAIKFAQGCLESGESRQPAPAHTHLMQPSMGWYA